MTIQAEAVISCRAWSRDRRSDRALRDADRAGLRADGAGQNRDESFSRLRGFGHGGGDWRDGFAGQLGGERGFNSRGDRHVALVH